MNNEIALITGTSVPTIYVGPYANGPICRCGNVHIGDYAAEDRAHHECYHGEKLAWAGDGVVICPSCGKTWTIADK